MRGTVSYTRLEVIIAQMNAFFICNFPILFLGGGNSNIKVMGMIILLVPFRVKIRDFLALSVPISKMTSARGMVVAFRVLSQKYERKENINVSQLT